MNAAWKLCTTVLHIRRNELLMKLVCAPTPCFCTYIEAKFGTRNGGFPESWTAVLGSTKKSEHRLKFQAPKGFSIHHLSQSLAIVQIQTHILTSGGEVSSAWTKVCLAQSCPSSQGFQQDHRLLGESITK